MDAQSCGAKLVENAELIQMCHVTQWMSHVTYEGVMCHTHTHTHTHGGLESRTKASRQHRVNMNVSCHTMDESRHMTNEAHHTHTHGRLESRTKASRQRRDQETCLTVEWVTSHTHTRADFESRIKASRQRRDDEACHKMDWVTSRDEWVMSHTADSSHEPTPADNTEKTHNKWVASYNERDASRTHTHTADSSHGPKPIDNAEKLSFWLASVLPGIWHDKTFYFRKRALHIPQKNPVKESHSVVYDTAKKKSRFFFENMFLFFEKKNQDSQNQDSFSRLFFEEKNQDSFSRIFPGLCLCCQIWEYWASRWKCRTLCENMSLLCSRPCC